MEQKLTVANKVAYGMSDFGNNLGVCRRDKLPHVLLYGCREHCLAATGFCFWSSGFLMPLPGRYLAS